MKSPSYTSPDIGTAPINGNGHAPGTLSAPTLPMEHLPHELEGGTDFDEGRRGRNYRRANEQMPAVRVHELSLMREKVAAQPGQRILDFGCGTGVLSLPVAAQVGATGEVVAVADVDVVAHAVAVGVTGAVLAEAGIEVVAAAVTIAVASSTHGTSCNSPRP